MLLKTLCSASHANDSCVTLQIEKQRFGNRPALSQGSKLNGYWELQALRRNVGISISIKRTSQNSLICHVPWYTRKFLANGSNNVVTCCNKQSPISSYFLIVPVIQVWISLARLVNRYRCFAGLTVLDQSEFSERKNVRPWEVQYIYTAIVTSPSQIQKEKNTGNVNGTVGKRCGQSKNISTRAKGPT